MEKITKAKIKYLVNAWKGHIKNNTDCSECSDKKTKCPINKFFLELEKGTVEVQGR